MGKTEMQTFIDKNKQALIEEMAENINNINTLVNAANQSASEDVTTELIIMKNIIASIAQNVGALTTCFNQYMIFKTGKISTDRSIGFKTLLNNDSEDDD